MGAAPRARPRVRGATVAKRIVVDSETRSLADLRKVGAWRYAEHPLTDVWCAAYAIDDGPVLLWVPGAPLPPDLLDAIGDPDCILVAHHVSFERCVWRHVLTPRHGWPELPPLARWSDTMSRALALALPPRLDKLAAALSLPEQKADKSIVALMAKPRRPRGSEDPAGIYWFDDSEHRQTLHNYCKQDVEVERALDKWLRELSPSEHSLWCLDAIINDRGVYCDGVLIDKAIAIATAAERAVQDELRQITNGEVNTTNCRDKLMAWLAARGCEVADCEKETLRRALTRKGLDHVVRRVMELRQEAAHASAAKMQALQNWRGLDGRVRGGFRYHGAATGRWSGAGPQFQNFRRETENTAAKLETVMSGDIDKVRALGSPIEVIGDIARCAVCAPPGYKLLKADYGAIESRVLAWVAGERAKLDLWSRFDCTGELRDDPYYVLGRLLGFPEETARQCGKIADLAFGYGGGVGAFRNFAPDDVDICDADIKAFQQAWRAKHPQTVQFWYGIDRAAIAAIQRAPQEIDYGKLTLRCEKLHEVPFLLIRLPSGRDLAYPFAKLIRNDRGDRAVTFKDNALGQWVEVRQGRGVWGGIFTANIVSGIARDRIAAAMLRLEAAGYPVVIHVHDQIACEVPA
jgi:DNA polymerase